MDLLTQYGLRQVGNIDKQLEADKKYAYQFHLQKPPLLKYIKKKIGSILPRLEISIIEDNDNIRLQKRFQRFFLIVFQDKIVYRQKYEYWTEFSMKQQSNSVSIKHYLTLNSIKIKVNGHLNKKINLKLCSKLNQSFESFKLCFQPITGGIQFSNNFTITQKQMDIMSKFERGSNHLVEVIIQSIQNGFKYLDLLLVLCGHFPLSQLLKNQIFLKQFMFLRQANEVIENLEKQLFKLHIFSPKGSKNQSQLGFFCSSQKAKQSIQYFSQNSQKILDLFTATKNNIYFTSETDKIKQQDIDLDQKYQVKSNYLKKSIFTQIFIQDQPNKIQWQNVSQGGFGFIQAAVINFRDLSSSSSQYEIKKQILVKKSDKFQNKKKIPRQKQILKRIQYQIHPNILKFFYSMQTDFQDYLFSQYSPNMSLDLYLQKSKKSIGIDKIIFFLCQSARGLQFLHNHQIIHLDLKPGNIIISKHLRLMISDFGEAFVKGGNVADHSHAYTIPYCAPQIFQSPPIFIQQTDAYAIGVIVYSLIFQCKVWVFMDKKRFLQRLKDGSLTKTFCPQKEQNQILQKFYKIVHLLVVKCTEKDYRLRPKMQWILFVIQELQKYILLLCE